MTVERLSSHMRLVIFGPPGSGKGTYASRLQKKLGVDVVAMGDIFREIIKEDSPLGRRVKGFVERGLLVPDDIVIEVLEQRLVKSSNRNGFILDGFPRTIEQAKALENITKIDGVVLLTVPEWIIVERLSTRRICRNCGEVYNIRYLKPKVEGICDKCGGPLYQRPDDTEKVIKERIGIYERQTQPILQHYRSEKVPFVELKTEKIDMPPEFAVEEIMRGLKKQELA